MDPSLRNAFILRHRNLAKKTDAPLLNRVTNGISNRDRVTVFIPVTGTSNPPVSPTHFPILMVARDAETHIEIGRTVGQISRSGDTFLGKGAVIPEEGAIPTRGPNQGGVLVTNAQICEWVAVRKWSPDGVTVVISGAFQVRSKL